MLEKTQHLYAHFSSRLSSRLAAFLAHFEDGVQKVPSIESARAAEIETAD